MNLINPCIYGDSVLYGLVLSVVTRDVHHSCRCRVLVRIHEMW